MPVSIRATHLCLAIATAASAAAVGCLSDAPEPPSASLFAAAGSGGALASAGGSGVPAGTSSISGAAGFAAGGAGGAVGAAGAQVEAGMASTLGGASAGGSGGTAGTSSTGGGGVGGSAGGAAGPLVDPRGTLRCDTTALNLGEMHLLTNEWTDPLADTCVFLDLAGNFGWKWTRGSTGMGNNPDYPNYPELEFGINPWNMQGLDQSTTTLLPIQLKELSTASMTVDVFTDVGANNSGWNLAFELWLADKNPNLGPANPKGEMMVFLSNWPGYYPQSPETTQTLNDGNHDYKLYVSSDNWGTWGYYRQYRLDTHDGKFNGKLDIARFLKHFVEDEHWDSNLWVTRFELGNEVYQNSAGATTVKSLSFEVNGQVRNATTQ